MVRVKLRTKGWRWSPCEGGEERKRHSDLVEQEPGKRTWHFGGTVHGSLDLEHKEWKANPKEDQNDTAF